MSRHRSNRPQLRFATLREASVSASRKPSERGVALILVVFIVALASILVLDLAHSANIGARQNMMVERSLQAEYLLKSALNVARTLIKEDGTPEEGPQDVWAAFAPGILIPEGLLGLHERNVQVWLEIRPESSKLRLSNLVPTGQAPDTRWVEVFTKLFVDLGFDDDGEEEQNPPFRGRNFRAEELVANLIDYQDRDSESQPLGIERDLPEGTFANSHIRDINELRAIPGFTPNRIRRLMPYVTAVGEQRVNVNFAPPLVLRALHDSMTDPVVAQIVAFREGPDGPIETHAQQATLTNFISNDDYSELSPLIDTRSNWFQVVAKVEYVGAARYYLRATVFREGTGTLPIITSVELY